MAFSAAYNATRLGNNHPNWRGGKRKVERGHVRITHGPNKGKYEHRLVMDKLIKEWNFYGWTEIPPKPPKGSKEVYWSVHHLDFNEAHNCPGNLLILDHRIHQAFIKDYRVRYANGEFAPQSYSDPNQEIPF